ncbi:helix-turn-helix domain-containing protein [Chondromyces apiculatus]|uniref:Uncharacterized protein n=1 Tax=Chondromyces apiculatus DSM 436 TaxID=1192034 RepID=A0A017TAZ6_9BACT|nr:helix-turn-helix transcriptional regulator [Chondromyces apiculatus]EYF05796.1 Hypothetical protein CAP_2797 [Chondromyces apiculatus DSM 436]
MNVFKTTPEQVLHLATLMVDMKKAGTDDIQDAIDDDADAPQVPLQKLYLPYDKLEDVAQRVMAEKAKLRRLIDRHGGVSAVAAKSGIPQPSLSRMLNSPSISPIPRRATLYKIAIALGLPGMDIIMEWTR